MIGYLQQEGTSLDLSNKVWAFIPNWEDTVMDLKVRHFFTYIIVC